MADPVANGAHYALGFMLSALYITLQCVLSVNLEMNTSDYFMCAKKKKKKYLKVLEFLLWLSSNKPD